MKHYDVKHQEIHWYFIKTNEYLGQRCLAVFQNFLLLKIIELYVSVNHMCWLNLYHLYNHRFLSNISSSKLTMINIDRLLMDGQHDQ